MIVFNIYAVIVVVVVLIIIGPFYYWILPESFVQSYGDIVLFGGASFIAGVCEVLGIKGRVFFLPMWLVFLVICCYSLWAVFGWTGVGIGVGCVLVLITLFAFWIWKSEQKDWENAPLELLEAQKTKSNDPSACWKHIEKAFFTPVFKSYSREVCEHNLKVVDLIIELEGEFQLAIDYRAIVEPGTQPLSSISMDTEKENDLKEYIEKRADPLSS